MTGNMLSHYQLIEKIGEGGMGVVWKAKDTILDRFIAIKILPVDASRDETRRRMFRDEAKLASSLGHSHVVQVHELGREGDIDFIVMELVEGKTLGHLLRERPLPADEVASLGLQVASALASAHHKGLLHRDIKPANIMMTHDGDAKIVDFGLATLFERHDNDLLSEFRSQSETQPVRDNAAIPAPQLTIPGTVPYMSPEQVRGEHLDGRSDIFSLGAVLYEMTTGRRPFTGATTSEVLRELLKCQPLPPHEIAPTIPLDLERIIQKAMARRPADRYQTMDDLAVDLKRLGRELDSGSSPSFNDLARRPPRRRPWKLLLLLAAALVLIVAASVRLVGGFAERSSAVLVMPLQIRAGARDDPYLGRAFAEGLAVNIAAGGGLEVLPVPADVASPDDLSFAKRAHAGRMITGSVARHDSLVDVRISLIDVRRNRLTWGAELQSVAGSPSQMAVALAAQVREQCGLGPGPVYEYFRYVLGSPALTASPDLPEAIAALRSHDYERALAACDRIIAQFPRETAAYVMKYHAAYDASNAGIPGLGDATRQLLAIDPLNPNPVITSTSHGPEIRLHEFAQLLARRDLTPACRAYALRTRGVLWAAQEKPSEARADFEEALRLDPANPWTHAYTAEFLFDRDPEAAVMHARAAIALDPSQEGHREVLAVALLARGDTEAALAAFEEMPITIQNIGAGFALELLARNHRKEALEIAERAENLAPRRGGLYDLARVYARSGHPAHALRLLRRARELGPFRRDPLVEPDFRALSQSELRELVSTPED